MIRGTRKKLNRLIYLFNIHIGIMIAAYILTYRRDAMPGYRTFYTFDLNI